MRSTALSANAAHTDLDPDMATQIIFAMNRNMLTNHDADDARLATLESFCAELLPALSLLNDAVDMDMNLMSLSSSNSALLCLLFEEDAEDTEDAEDAEEEEDDIFTKKIDFEILLQFST